MFAFFRLENLKEKDHLEDLSMNVKIKIDLKYDGSRLD